MLGFVAPAFGQAPTQPAAEAAKPKEASIPFAQLGGIENWRADGREGLYIEGRNKKWYYAKLMSPCTGLEFAIDIGFVIEPSGSFDRFSAILVEGTKCQLKSLTPTEKPQPKKK